MPDEGFQPVVYKKKQSRPTSGGRGGFSSPAERFINASEMQVFKVPPGLGGLVRDNREVIQNRLFAQAARDQILPVEAHRWTMSLLDAFASLLVSQREKEVISVAVSPISNKHYIFWIAASGPENRLEAAKQHMEELWAILKQARAEVPPGMRRHQKTPDEADVGSDPASDIYNACYTYSRERLKKHFDKPREKEMYSALVNARSDPEKYNLQGEELEFVDGLIELFRLYKIYEAGSSDLEEAQENAYNMTRQCSEVNKARHNLGDRNVSFLERILPLCNGDPSDGTLYGRLLDKMLILDASIERLMVLPTSGSMGRILDEDVTLEVRTVDESTADLHYNFAEDKVIRDAMSDRLPMAFDDFINRIKPLKDSSGHRVIRKDRARFHVHAECSLLAHIDKTKNRTFNYFGISKLCCIGCWLFFQAYNSLNPSVPKYYVRGAHSRQYPWVAPPDKSMTYRDDSLTTMEPLAKDFFRGLLPKSVFIRQCSFSESSSALLTDHKRNKDWDGIYARSKKLHPVPPPGWK